MIIKRPSVNQISWHVLTNLNFDKFEFWQIWILAIFNFCSLSIQMTTHQFQVRDELCVALCEELTHAAALPNASRQQILFPLKVVRIFLAEIEELSPLLLQRLAVPILEFVSQ